MILFVNACVREESRTRQFAEKLLEKLGEDYVELKLEDVKFPKTDEAFLKNRDDLIANKNMMMNPLLWQGSFHQRILSL